MWMVYDNNAENSTRIKTKFDKKSSKERSVRVSSNHENKQDTFLKVKIRLISVLNIQDITSNIVKTE